MKKILSLVTALVMILAMAGIAGAEGALSDMGYTDLRVRVFHGAARLQLPGTQMADAIARRVYREYARDAGGGHPGQPYHRGAGQKALWKMSGII